MRDQLSGDVRDAAKALLGCLLVRGGLVSRIVETEAYRGLDDPGSHAFRGPTPRNEIMFGQAGHAYVYFTYGTHWMLNVTAEQPGIGAAVLIRAAEPLEGIEQMVERRPKALRAQDLLSGPGKIAAAYGITRAENGVDLLSPSSELRIEPCERQLEVLEGTRIGLSPGKGDLLEWRFVDADRLQWVSRPLKGLRRPL